ncbi:hypothetical protein NOK12_06370 [Nocardioides sp. OK12]|uniref:hypothetical protein n=1 Tax=Nocardioides sp. OK12 TaxID=2758661 RepID=UPI0021C3E484|nr:hypothetical protein [Nocardioides sp. OK12]GHJ58118.1 hypothetical protein NOK12_06370 [Nocardioides sp. OK12]
MLWGSWSLVLLVVYIATVARDRVVNDVLSAALAAWRIATTGEPWFDGFPLEQIPTAPHQHLWTGLADNGHVAVFRSPGAIAAGVPAYLFGRGTEPQDFSVVPAGVLAAVLVVAALLLYARALLTVLPTAQVVAALTALALTTPIWSNAANSLWPHTVTLVGIAGMAWACSRERWWLLGLFGGVALWGRLHAVLVVALLGLGLALWRRRAVIAVRAGTVSAGFLGLAFVWTHEMYGKWEPTGGYDASSVATNATTGGPGGSGLVDRTVNQLGLWISPDRGILVWTPVLLLLLPAVVRSWRVLPDWSRLLLAAGLAYTFVQGLINHFGGGVNFYGYRLTLELLACSFPAYAMAATRAGPVGRRLLGPVLGLQLGVISLGAVTESFFVPVTEAWTDSSLALALREFPWLIGWLALTTLIGALAGQVYADRFGPLSAPAGPAAPASPRAAHPGRGSGRAAPGRR